jgi:hypothetical protein
MLFAGTSGKFAEMSSHDFAVAFHWNTWPTPAPSPSVKRRLKPLIDA